MIGQSYYYLNNKKYLTNITNCGTIISEVNNFYHTRTPRAIKIVEPSEEGHQLLPNQLLEEAEAMRTGSTDLIEFVEWEDASTIEFIENSDKCIVAYTDEADMLDIYVRYTQGLLTASGFYASHATSVDQIAAEFVTKVCESDALLTIMNDSALFQDTLGYCNQILADADKPAFTVQYENGKNFSYDLLFFLNDYYPCDAVKSLIIEKFTIHSSEITRDIMEQFTGMRRDLAYICAVIDWMNANATAENRLATDKADFINRVFVEPHTAENRNWTVPFYALADLWNKVKDNADFKAAHAAKSDGITSWEYNDEYNELNYMIPMTKKILEQTWDINNLSAELKLLEAEVQFFAKRQNRIPYLIHKYSLV